MIPCTECQFNRDKATILPLSFLLWRLKTCDNFETIVLLSHPFQKPIFGIDEQMICGAKILPLHCSDETVCGERW